MSRQAATYILAEMAASHEGNPQKAGIIIEGASKAKADGILFQIIDLDTYIIPTDEDYRNVKSFYMNQENWSALINKANSLGLEVWGNVYDLASVRLCENKKVKGYKLHAANLENEELVKAVVATGKEVALSVGGMQKEEIAAVFRLIRSVDEKADVHLMYGLQNFPTNPEGINLNFIRELSAEYGVAYGYQDHSEPDSAASVFLPVLAVATGASVIEKHLTHDRSLKGEDYEAALNPDEFAEFVKNIRIVDGILAKKPDEVSVDELVYRQYKTLMKVVAKQAIKPGDTFTEDNLAVMRSRKGEVEGKRIKALPGKKAKSGYEKFEPLKSNEISGD